uniref:Uncharacterized protein n=1 Tax=viral metagenome TaxID=1070528 RepID=A0A2V0RA23_9ZZZZ
MLTSLSAYAFRMKNYYTHQPPFFQNWNSRVPFPQTTLLQNYNLASSSTFNVRPSIPINLDNDSISIDTALTIISGRCFNHQTLIPGQHSTDYMKSTTAKRIYEYYFNSISTRICDDVLSLQENGSTQTFPTYFNTSEFSEYLSYLYLSHETRMLNGDSMDYSIDYNCLFVIEALFSYINLYPSNYSDLITNCDFSRVYKSFISDALFQTNELILYSECSNTIPSWRRQLHVGISSSVVCYPSSIPYYNYLNISSAISVPDILGSIAERVITAISPYLGPANNWRSIINSDIESNEYSYSKLFPLYPNLEVYTHEVIWQQLGLRPTPAEILNVHRSFEKIPGCVRILEEFIYRYSSYEILSTLILEASMKTGLDVSSLPKCSTETQAKFLNKLSKLLFHFRYPLNIISYLNGTPFLLSSSLFSDNHRSPYWDFIDKCPSSKLNDTIYTGTELFNYYIYEYSQTPSFKYDPADIMYTPIPLTEQYIQDIDIALHASEDSEITLSRSVNSADLQEYEAYVFENPTRFNNIKLDHSTNYSIFAHGSELAVLRSRSAEDQMAETVLTQERQRSESKLLKNDSDDNRLRDFLISKGNTRYDTIEEIEEGIDQNNDNVVELTQTTINYDQSKRSLAIPAIKFIDIDRTYYYDDLLYFIERSSNIMSIQPWNKSSKEGEEFFNSKSNELLTDLYTAMTESNATNLVNSIMNEIRRVRVEKTRLGSLQIKYIPELSSELLLNERDKLEVYKNRAEVIIISARCGEYRMNSSIIEFNEATQLYETINVQSDYGTYTDVTTYNELDQKQQNEATKNLGFNRIAERNNEDLVSATPYTIINDTLRKVFYNIIEIVSSECNTSNCISTQIEEINKKYTVKYNKMLIIDVDNPSIMLTLLRFKSKPYTIQDFTTAYTAVCLEIDANHKLAAQFTTTSKLDASTELLNEDWECGDSMTDRIMSKAMKFAQFTRICIQS